MTIAAATNYRTSAGPRRVLPLITWPDWPAGSAMAVALESLRAEHTRISDDLRTNRLALTAAEKGRNVARKQDEDEYARSLREGTDDPRNKHQVALDKEIADRQRRMAGLLAARLAVQDEVQAILSARGAELQREIAALIVERRAEATAAVEAAVLAVGDLQAAKGMLGWLRDPTRRATPPNPYTAVKAATGDHLSATVALSAVNDWLAGDVNPVGLGHLGEKDNRGDDQ